MSPVLECVPNFSEGRDPKIIANIAEAIRGVKGAVLMNTDSGFHAHRTVYTFAGDPPAVVEAAYQSMRVASEQIDMRKHSGAHPRIGALDVCPLIPIAGISMEEAIQWSRLLGKRIADTLDVPVYLYEKSAQVPERANLATLRKGEYEGLQKKIESGLFAPDFGRSYFNPKCGICIVGARPFLIAYNVNISTTEIVLAKEIAAQLRENGPPGRKHSLRGVKAIGWYIEEFGHCQVSTNIVDIEAASLTEVYNAVTQIAATYGVEVQGSELIGMIPAKVIHRAYQYLSMDETRDLDSKAKAVAQKIGLDSLKPFDPLENIIELYLKI